VCEVGFPVSDTSSEQSQLPCFIPRELVQLSLMPLYLLMEFQYSELLGALLLGMNSGKEVPNTFVSFLFSGAI
jgi:hypothetical protein